MNELIKEYLAWKGTYAPRASVNYKLWLMKFLEVCGEKPLEKYEVADLVKYQSWLAARYNPCSVQYAIIIFKNFLRYCQTQNLKCLSPSLVRLPRSLAKSHRAVKQDEFNKIISVIPTKDFMSLRDSLIIRMLWDTGVRVAELCDLDVSQIDENKKSTVIQTKKNGPKRIIVWSDETHKLLMRYMTLRLEQDKVNATALFMGWQQGDGWSMRITTRSVQRIIRNYVARAGIKERITPHSFRHGWAHVRRDKNAPLAFIQRGLGHLNPISTFVYEQYNDNEFEANANSYLQAA